MQWLQIDRRVRQTPNRLTPKARLSNLKRDRSFAYIKGRLPFLFVAAAVLHSATAYAVDVKIVQGNPPLTFGFQEVEDQNGDRTLVFRGFYRRIRDKQPDSGNPDRDETFNIQ